MAHIFRYRSAQWFSCFKQCLALLLILANILPYTLAFAQEAPPPPPPPAATSTHSGTPPPAAPAPVPPPDLALQASTPEDGEESEGGGEELLEGEGDDTTPLHNRDPLRHAQEPSPYDGSFTYTFPLRVPPGRNGVQPDPVLQYNNGSAENLFGFGWSVNIPYIKRINKQGVEALHVSTSTQYFYSSEDGELATTSSSMTSYGPRSENGSFRQYTYSTTTGWTVIDKAGTTFKFGYSSTTRQDNSNATTSVYKWLLEEVRDTNGNFMTYEYYKHKNQVYPYKVTYTHATSTGIFEVEFLRESRTDISTSTATGFSVVTEYRINEIQAKINSAWVTKYALTYTTGDNGYRSLLSSITETGKDENGNTLSLPATSFAYQSLQTSQMGWTQNAYWVPPDYFTFGNDDRGVRLGELNDDALIDFMRSTGVPAETMAYANNGGGHEGGWQDRASVSFPFSFAGTGEGLSLFDANGDGLTDLIRLDTRSVYINNGDETGWTASSSWVIPSDVGTDGVRYGDVNGDGLVDILKALISSTTAAYINNGNGTGWTKKTSYSFPSGAYFYGAGLVEDFNGDGLGDLYLTSHTASGTFINNGDGTGWTADPRWAIPGLFLSSGGTRFADINGDNLVDLIKSSTTAGVLSSLVHLHRGIGWATTTSWSVPSPFAMDTYNDSGLRLGDANGDGLIDLIRAADLTSTFRHSFLNNAEAVDLLTGITESSGGKTSVEYKGSSEYAVTGTTTKKNPHLPFTLQTAYKIVKNDGFGTISTTTYDYIGGDLYYKNPNEKKFAGFEIITKVDPASNTIKTFYHQGNTSSSTRGEYDDHVSKIGKPFRVEVWDINGNLVSKTINKWDRADLGGNDRHYAKLHQAVEFTHDGDSDHREIAKSLTFDNSNGNITGQVEWGEVSGNEDGTFTDTGTDLASTSISYVATTTGYLTLPAYEKTTGYSGDKVKEANFYYDGNAATTSAISKGNLTKEERWKSGAAYIDIEKSYTPFGLVSGEKDPRDKETTYHYDQHQLYVATTTNPVGQVAHAYYDYSLGKAATTTDSNGRDHVTVYDALDRVKEVKGPDAHNPSSLVTNARYTYTDTGSRNIKEAQDLSTATSTDLYKYLDGFDRVIQERREAEDANTFSVRDFAYDKRGLLEKESIPYFATGSATTSATTSLFAFTNYTYDALQRITAATNTLGTVTYSYDDWRATTTDVLDRVKAIEKDAFGNIVRVNEINSTSTYGTLYEYNKLNNLTKITDALSNVRNFTYDGLGRRLTAEDLHASGDGTHGTWTFTYDDAGNLTTQLDPKSQTINFTYDDINRVLTEDYTGRPGTEITYTYDSCTDGTGRLCTASSTDAVARYTYWPNGLTKTEGYTISGLAATTTYAYDRQGNVTALTYPDGAQTVYRHNSAGLVEVIEHKESGAASTTLVQDIDVGPHGKAAYQDFFNGTVSSSTYDMNALWRMMNKTTYYDSQTLGFFSAVPLFDFLRSSFKRMPFLSYADAEELPGSIIAEGAASNSPADPETVSLEEVAEETASSSPQMPIQDDEENTNEASPEKFETMALDISVTPQTVGVAVPLNSSTPLEQLFGTPRPDLLTWNTADVREVTPGVVQTDIRAKWVRYLAGDGSFQPIDATLASTSEGWCMDQAPFKACFPFRSTGAALFHNNNRFDVRDKSVIFEEPLDLEITVPGADVAGRIERGNIFLSGKVMEDVEYAVYEEVFANTDLIYLIDFGRAPRLVKLFRCSQAPCPASYPFSESYSEEPEFDAVIAGQRTPWSKEAILRIPEGASLRVGVSDKRGMGKKPFRVWDSNTNEDLRKVSSAAATVERQGNAFHYEKAPAPSFYQDAVFPVWTDTTSTFYPDADPESTTFDGNCRPAGSAAYSTSHDATTCAGGDTSDSSTNLIAQNTYDPSLYYIRHTFFLFDTSSIPDANNIIAATTSIYDVSGEFGNADSDTMVLSTTTPASNTALSEDDFEQIGKTNMGSIALSATTRNAYNDILLNASGLAEISKTGVTKFGLRTLGDINNSTPTGVNRMAVYSSEQTGASQDPKLVVTHEAPAPPPAPPPVIPSGIQNLTYTYDTAGNILRIVDSSETLTYKSIDFGYDYLYRLTSASTSYSTSTYPVYRQTWGYNAVGNIATSSTMGNYGYAGTNYANPHAVTEIATTSNVALSYDNNGNLGTTTQGATTWTYLWNHQNRMTQAATGTATSTFAYDHAGNRVRMLVNGTATSTYPNKFYNVADATTTKHVFAGDQLVATIVGNGVSTSTYIVHTDHLDGTHVVTNASGAVVLTNDYYPYGEIRLSKGSISEQRGFTGHEADPSTGLNYMLARYQSGSRGTFLSEDPAFWNIDSRLLLDPQLQNSYSYGRNSPISYVDRNGETAYAVAKGIENNSLGTHLFIVLQPDNLGDFANQNIPIQEGGYWTLGGYADDSGSILIKGVNAKSDFSAYSKGAVKGVAEIGRPDGMSDTEFLKSLQSEYNSYAEDAQYDPFARRGYGYNSNNLVTTLINNAGGQLPFGGNAPGVDPGYGTPLGNGYIQSSGQSYVPSTRSQSSVAVGSYGLGSLLQQISATLSSISRAISSLTSKSSSK